MNLSRTLKAAFAALLLGVTSQAMADVITVKATGLPSTNFLTAGKYQGSFDLHGLAMPAAYTVNSLSFMFTFADDGDPFTTVTGATTSSTGTLVTSKGADRTATTTTTYLVPVTSTGEKESVKLSFGSLDLFGQTGALPSTVSDSTQTKPAVKGSDVYMKNNEICTTEQIKHDSSCKKVTFYTVEQTTTRTTMTDYSSSFTLQGSLLASLLQDKVLNFGFDVTGDLYLAGASLTVGYLPTQSQDAVGDVPEPASLALFGIALAGIAGLRRQRRA